LLFSNFCSSLGFFHRSLGAFFIIIVTKVEATTATTATTATATAAATATTVEPLR
jgi:hypothetical protein